MISSQDSAVGREEEMDRLRVMHEVSSIPDGNNNFKTFNKRIHLMTMFIVSLTHLRQYIHMFC